MTSPEPQTDFEENSSETSFEQPPKKRRWLWLFLAVPLLLGGGAVIWRLLTPENSAPSTANVQPQGVRVKISTVQSGMIEESSDFIASLESQRSVNLRSRIQGQVTQMFVKLGDSVTQGAAIIQIDAKGQPGAPSGINAAPQAFLMQLANARATLKSLEAERSSYVSNVQLSQEEYEKYSSLAQQGAVSRQASNQYADRLTAAKTSLNAIDSRIQAQRATILQAEKSLQQANININQQPVQIQYDKITAPFSGTVGEISVKVGDFVNTSTQLVTVMQNRPLEVKISVPVQRKSLLREGMPVEIMNTQGQKLGRTRIFSIAPNASNQTQGILIKALFNNSNGQVRANQLARARLIWNERPGILIPTAAVTRVGGQTFVYVVETEKSPQGVSQEVARQRRVKLGEIKGNNYQVMEGLQPEDKIIISGLLNLTDGVAIAPEF
jgi:RND family efflux transporter MFP subunit